MENPEDRKQTGVKYVLDTLVIIIILFAVAWFWSTLS